MTVVQPPTNVVQPNSDFELLDEGRRLVYHARTKSRVRVAFVMAAMFILLPVGVGSCGIGALSGRNEGGGYFVFALLAFAAWIALIFWSNQKIVRSITFTEGEISFDGNTYLLEHVPSIGWRSGGGYATIGSGFTGQMLAAGAQANHEMSGEVYMQYGADEISIIKNLPPKDVESTYAKIVGFLSKFGHKYGS